MAWAKSAAAWKRERRNRMHAVLVWLAFTAFAIAAPGDDSWTKCNAPDAEVAVAACSTLIDAEKTTPAERAQALFPASSTAYHNRAAANIQRGLYDRALPDLQRAVEVDPTNPMGYLSRGSLYEAQHRFELALADFDRAIELNPASAGAYSNRCWIKVVLYRVDLADCNRAVALAPNDRIETGFYAAALGSRGYAFLRLKRAAAAVRDFSAALAIAPNRPSTLYGRGLAKRLTGDKAGGNADMAAAARIKQDVAAEYARYGFTPR
jgi:tetratricopeptide (TPR) repeat protein